MKNGKLKLWSQERKCFPFWKEEGKIKFKTDMKISKLQIKDQTNKDINFFSNLKNNIFVFGIF